MTSAGSLLPLAEETFVPKRKKALSLITVEGVKDLRAKGVDFRVRYELMERASYGRRPPRYRCIYVLPDGEEAVLVASRVSSFKGAEPRYFLLWPGLIAHHHEFGDGRALCLFDDFSIETRDVGRDGVPVRRDDPDNGGVDGPPPGRDGKPAKN